MGYSIVFSIIILTDYYYEACGQRSETMWTSQPKEQEGGYTCEERRALWICKGLCGKAATQSLQKLTCVVWTQLDWGITYEGTYTIAISGVMCMLFAVDVNMLVKDTTCGDVMKTNLCRHKVDLIETANQGENA